MSESEKTTYSIYGMKFPEKLWNIVNTCSTGAIGWSSTGKSIVMEYDKFRDEFLNGEKAVFKTNNVSSFIRQLNLYGFRKCNKLNEEFHEFSHPYFIKDRRELLIGMHRKFGYVTDSDSSMKRYKIFKENSSTKISGSKLFVDKEETVMIQERKAFKPRKRLSLTERQNISEDSKAEINYWSSLEDASNHSLSYVRDGWLPADAKFYNSQKLKDNSNDSQDKEIACCSNSLINGNAFNAPNNIGNMYYFFVPGYALQEHPHMFGNQGFPNGVLPFAGLPMEFKPDVKANGIFPGGNKSINLNNN